MPADTLGSSQPGDRSLRDLDGYAEIRACIGLLDRLINPFSDDIWDPFDEIRPPFSWWTSVDEGVNRLNPPINPRTAELLHRRAVIRERSAAIRASADIRAIRDLVAEILASNGSRRSNIWDHINRISRLCWDDHYGFANTRIDWKETPEGHVFEAYFPGFKKEEVKVQVEDGRVLQISGERSLEEEGMTDTGHRVERSSDKFLRRFRLPENAKADQVKVAMEYGVLTVTVPKEEVNDPETK